MAKYISNFNVHGTQFDMCGEKAGGSHYAASADWLTNDSYSTYHFSAENASSAIPLYNTDNTKFWNEEIFLPIARPTFDSLSAIPDLIVLENKSASKQYAVQYSVNDTQPYYDVNTVSTTWSNEQTCTEYMLMYNNMLNSNVAARIPFKFTVCLHRKNRVVSLTPDYDGSKPLAHITKICGVDVKQLAVKGPAYILGSCMIRPNIYGVNASFPRRHFRANSREMFFWMNTDETSSEYCNIYLCNSNCKPGHSRFASAYHCSYTQAQLNTMDYIEMTFNTVLYVLFR